MRVKDIKPGLVVWVPWHTFKRVTVVRQEGQYRTIVQTDEGKELWASTRTLEAHSQE